MALRFGVNLLSMSHLSQKFADFCKWTFCLSIRNFKTQCQLLKLINLLDKRQQSTTNNDYVVYAGYELMIMSHEGGRHKISAKNERAGNRACAHHCLPPFFRKLSSLLMNCGIYFVFIPGITIPGITFLIPRLNNSILSQC